MNQHRIGTPPPIPYKRLIKSTSDILDVLLTQIVERLGQLIPDLLTYCSRDADPTGLWQPFQSRRNIHAIAEDVVLLNDHIAEVDADAKLDPLGSRNGGVAPGHPPLHLNRTAHGVDDALELGKETIAGVLYDPAPVLRDLRIDQFPEVAFQPLVRPLLIGAPIRREYPATSAARIAVRRRTGGKAVPTAVGRIGSSLTV